MFGYRPRKAFSLVMLADVPLEARSQFRRLQFFSVDMLCTWRDQACAVRMRDAFMNGFLLDIIDRLSTQKKQSRQAAVTYRVDIKVVMASARKPTLSGEPR